MTIEIISRNATLQQTADDCDMHSDEQTLDIETADAGAGHYVVIATDRWAISDREAGHALIDLVFDELRISDDA